MITHTELLRGQPGPCNLRVLRVSVVNTVAALLPIPLLLGACASPEGSRVRGGGPGADVGNRRAIVEIHKGARPYYESPCATTPVECQGPLPVFGPAPPSE